MHRSVGHVDECKCVLQSGASLYWSKQEGWKIERKVWGFDDNVLINCSLEDDYKILK